MIETLNKLFKPNLINQTLTKQLVCYSLFNRTFEGTSESKNARISVDSRVFKVNYTIQTKLDEQAHWVFDQVTEQVHELCALCPITHAMVNTESCLHTCPYAERAIF